MPQVIVKKRKLKEATEGLEGSRLLAKQVLCQLSYTPIEIGSLRDYNVFMLRVLSSRRN